MTIIEKYEYKSNGVTKIARKEDLKTLLDIERLSIKAVNPEIYMELRKLANRFAKDWEVVEFLTDTEGIVSIKISSDFDKAGFEAQINPKWNGHWRFA